MSRIARIRNVTLNCIVAERVENARSLWNRLIGLLPFGDVEPGEGLWFDRCSSIHTVGMRAAIDVIFLDANQRVLDVRPAVRPNRLIVWNPRAKSLIELGASPSERCNIRVGDQLALES